MYNPNQPRLPAGDRYGGRWTSTGLGGGAADRRERGRHGAPHGDHGGGVQVAGVGALAQSLRGLGPFGPAMVPYLLGVLARMAEGGLGQTAFLGGLAVAVVSELEATYGTLPDHPDIHYRYKAGILTLWQDVPGENKPLIYHGPAGADGLYRLPDGTVIGRDLGQGVFLSQAAAGNEKRRRATARADVAGRTEEGPERCPSPTLSPRNNDNPEWRRYQEYITGRSADYEVAFSGERFDDCRNEPGQIVLIDAKDRYSQFIKEDGSGWHDWYDDPRKIPRQMSRQCIAAGGRRIEWRVSQRRTADFFREIAGKFGCENLVVIWDRPPWQAGEE